MATSQPILLISPDDFLVISPDGFFINVGTVATEIATPQSQSPGLAEYKVRLKDTDGNVVAEFDNWRSLSFSHKVNSVSVAQFTIDGNDPRVELFVKDGVALVDSQLEVWRRNPIVDLDWYIEWEGFYITPEFRFDNNDDLSFTAYCVGYLDLTSRAYIMYTAESSQSLKSGVGETVMKEFVSENIGTSATVANGRIAEGVRSGLSVQADSGFGSNWEGGRAYKNLLSVLKEISVETAVDFDIVGVGDALFEFQAYNQQRGTDRSLIGLDSSTGLNGAGNAPVIFSLGFGNLAVPVLTIPRAKEINRVYVLGPGQVADRQIVTRNDTDAQAASPWNVRESVRNATSQQEDDVESALETIGDEILSLNRVQEKLNFGILQLKGQYYGKDYTWGDLMSARLLGQDFNKQLVKVTIQVSAAVNGENISGKFADISE